MKNKIYLEKSFSILKDLKEDGYSPDILVKHFLKKVYNFIIQTSARTGDLQSAEKVYQMINNDELEKDQTTYCAMIRACSLVDEKEKAKVYFNEMYTKELCPTFVVFEDLYNALKGL
jgi:pentatricopeptide repeat protein